MTQDVVPHIDKLTGRTGAFFRVARAGRAIVHSATSKFGKAESGIIIVWGIGGIAASLWHDERDYTSKNGI
jgi:hypothetical protein